MSKLTDIVNDVIVATNSNTEDIATNTSDIATETSTRTTHLSVPTAYHLYNGTVEATNTVITNGFSTTLYTGNGSTQSINTGVDMATQWGNDSSETYGGLVWLKSRSTTQFNDLRDSIRGGANAVYSNATTAQENRPLSSFLSNGVTVTDAGLNNASGVTYASWNFQTTHRRTGTTNHGKAFTEHYNPFTGFTIIKYEGSGLAGHEIPHSLGRKLGFWSRKSLNITRDWVVGTSLLENYYGGLNTTIAFQNDGADHRSGTCTDTAWIDISNDSSTNQYILYGWANSYFDEANTLIGNYEIGVYQGTGASGNKVTTRGKPAWVMQKRLDAIGNWNIMDCTRTSFDKVLISNLSDAEVSANVLDVVADGFILQDTSIYVNTSGGQYLYMVVYDNDSGSGKSKYPKATDSTTLNINATVPYASGIDTNGSKVSIAYKNETISGVTLTQGKNYVYSKNDGTYGVSKYAPCYGSYNGFGDYFDLNSNKWYSGVSVFSDSCDSTSGWTTNNSTLATANGELVVTTTAGYGGTTKTATLVVGKKYRVNLGLVSISSGTSRVIIQSTSTFITKDSTGIATNIYIDFVASDVNTTITIQDQSNQTGAKITFDNIAVYPIKSDGTPDISSATELTPRNYLDCIVYADHNGQVEYVEQIAKTTYFDEVKANEYKGKNACTAWVNFDGTTTPPTIRDSYNVSSVVRITTGMYDIYFATPMDNANYSGTASTHRYATWADGGISMLNYYVNKVTVQNVENTGVNTPSVSVQIFGGKN